MRAGTDGPPASAVARARERVREARTVVVLTGAGVSAESGVPTFRGEDGLWKSHRPEELATPQAFRRDPRLVWEWYAFRRRIVASCAPNPAHRALARFQASRPGVTLVTQNVDGLHGRAAWELGEGRAAGGGPDGDAVLELHGSLFRVRCSACGRRSPRHDAVDASSGSTLPRCPVCDALLRPDVVWFGESLDEGLVARAFSVAESADLCLVVGTSAVVQPAASLPLATLRGGGSVVEVNPDRTPLTSRAAVHLQGPAGRILPALLTPREPPPRPPPIADGNTTT